MSLSEFRVPIEFTYIGNLPRGFVFDKAQYQPPMSGMKLAEAIRGNHVYVTASQNEPGSNHQNEGACCGLPLLYRDSGSLPEYCDGYGVIYRKDNLEEKLVEMMDSYDDLVRRMNAYPHTSSRTNTAYLQHFLGLLDQRDSILRGRDRWRQARWLGQIRPLDLARQIRAYLRRSLRQR
jgi:hypothetical protein